MSLEIPTDWTDPSMFKHKGVYFINDLYTPESIDAVEHFETRESDVFLVTYPKSGTIWTQQILSLIFNERHRNGTEVIDNQHRVPWIECNFRNIDYNARPSPRLFPSHLHYYLMPKELRNWKGKVIYVSRNPKDCMVSFYHFHNLFVKMTKARNWNHYFELFVSGKVFHGSWFEHIRGWYTHKEDFNFLFITYEKMKKDLQSAVLKICQFVGNELSKQEVDTVVEKSTFKSMKQDPLANYTFINKDILDTNKGNFLRKGIVGDWKNLMTVAQNERFEKIYQEKMKDLPISYTYDFYSKN